MAPAALRLDYCNRLEPAQIEPHNGNRGGYEAIRAEDRRRRRENAEWAGEEFDSDNTLPWSSPGTLSNCEIWDGLPPSDWEPSEDSEGEHQRFMTEVSSFEPASEIEHAQHGREHSRMGFTLIEADKVRSPKHHKAKFNLRKEQHRSKRKSKTSSSTNKKLNNSEDKRRSKPPKSISRSSPIKQTNTLPPKFTHKGTCGPVHIKETEPDRTQRRREYGRLYYQKRAPELRERSRQRTQRIRREMDQFSDDTREARLAMRRARQRDYQRRHREKKRKIAAKGLPVTATQGEDTKNLD